MNKVMLLGRLTRDPDVRYSQGEQQMAIARYTLAVNRRFHKDSEQSVDFIGDALIHAGSNPGPPIVIGVGLGGTSDKAAYLAKRALLRPVDQHNADPLYAEMEHQILDKVNASGVGPQGLGGTVTALACAIEPFGTHIAGLPCVVNISCHVTRHAEGEL